MIMKFIAVLILIPCIFADIENWQIQEVGKECSNNSRTMIATGMTNEECSDAAEAAGAAYFTNWVNNDIYWCMYCFADATWGYNGAYQLWEGVATWTEHLPAHTKCLDANSSPNSIRKDNLTSFQCEQEAINAGVSYYQYQTGVAGYSCLWTDNCSSPTSNTSYDWQVYTAAAAPVDADGDGFTSSTDCDDSNDAVNPGAAEVCDDNIDNNCDGNVDENCVTYSWGTPSAWSPVDCPSACGTAESQKTRTVTCDGSDGSTGSDDDCLGDDGSKPVTTETCSATIDCDECLSTDENCSTDAEGVLRCDDGYTANTSSDLSCLAECDGGVCEAGEFCKVFSNNGNSSGNGNNKNGTERCQGGDDRRRRRKM